MFATFLNWVIETIPSLDVLDDTRFKNSLSNMALDFQCQTSNIRYRVTLLYRKLFSMIRYTSPPSTEKQYHLRQYRVSSRETGIVMSTIVRKFAFIIGKKKKCRRFASERWHHRQTSQTYFPALHNGWYILSLWNVDAEMIEHLPWSSRFRFFFIFFSSLALLFLSNFFVILPSSYERVSNIKVHKKNYVNKNLSQFDKQRDAMKKRTFPKFRLAFCW